MSFLYEIFNNPFAKTVLAQIEIPSYIYNNLKFELRAYQIEAFKRYLYFDANNIEEKPKKPYHLLYNMATGSGKTMIMAGLLLHLYKMGYRNFLFFVNSANILQKTKENFLNTHSSKYMFKNKIIIDGKNVFIKELENFEGEDIQNINIKFTTIQKLHIELNNVKENSVRLEDFYNKKIVLIADEAHHLNAGTKQGELLESWESTVKKIHEANIENILLEFSATTDYESKEVSEKYSNKVIFKYDLVEFRKDKYSKEINLIRSLYDENERILQALILNLYRQELAASYNINLKPVILFKAKKTIAESERNKVRFHRLIDSLSEEMIEKIQKTSNIPIVKKAFMFFQKMELSHSEIVRRTKFNFRHENCLSANNDKEAEKNQLLLNSLEDEDNPIRAIFAVEKLKEGWDVLNLFDIVRLYDGRDFNAGKAGKTTISECQLIGRAARYFPFKTEDSQDKYKRKFDDDTSNNLKVLEEMYYHTREDSRYIYELKKVLIESGIYEDEDTLITKKLVLKQSFKESHFYQNGYVFFNKKILKSFSSIKSFEDLGVKKKNYRYVLSSGEGVMDSLFKEKLEVEREDLRSKDIHLTEIPKHIIRVALSAVPFFHFDSLSHYFPNIKSISEFIKSENYLGGVAITFIGTSSRLKSLGNFDYFESIKALLQEIEKDIKSNVAEYEGSAYIKEPIKNVFKDKDIRIHKDSERTNGQEALIAGESWYVYNANYGTSEEKKFVELFLRQFEDFNKVFEEIYLIRNEREIKIFDKEGRAFEPDFLLFCKSRDKQQMLFQVFIEPKGNHLLEHDGWKESFLKNIRSEGKTIKINLDTYIITAVPFYNYDNENEFASSLKETFELQMI